MIRNYLKIAWRNLVKNKMFSLINITGLALGLAVCMLIMLWVQNETSYDKYQPNADRVYRISRSFNNPETGAQNLLLSTIGPAFGPLLLNDFKEIESMTRTLQLNQTAVKYEDNIITESNMYCADDKFFEFFKADVLKGNPKKALADPYCVVMEEETAKKYFGNEDPVNKVIKINVGGFIDFKVTGIYKAFPSNTHFHPEILASFKTLDDTLIYGKENLRTSFSNNSFFTYIRLPQHYDPKKLETQFPAFIDRNMPIPDNAKFKSSKGTSLALQKLTDIHLRSHTDYEAEENGDIKRVYIFSVIALFILLIACINYMNLSTARSALRAREIGVRKVVGAERKQIMLQFLSESVLVTWIAMILAFGLTALLLPWMNDLSGQHLSMSALLKWQIILPILLAPFVVGVLSGLYPSLFMSSFKPIWVLKGIFRTGKSNISFRKVLVVLQFTVSIILIIATGIVFTQMRYMQKKSLGFDKEHIITMPYVTDLNDKFDAFRTELLTNSNIKNAGRSSRIPSGRLLDNSGVRMISGDTMAPVTAEIKYVVVDQDFISTYGLKMVAGRDFSREFSLDTSGFLINEAAAKVLGFKTNEEAVGKNFGYGSRNGKLIGVFKDFHFESLHQRIVPMVFFIPRNANAYGGISVRIDGADMSSALAHVEKTWKSFAPESPYQFNFMDESFARLYSAEDRQKKLFTTFAFIAILIACLGLYGLSAFAISQRVKEIGIRKVLGADIKTIVTLLSKNFLLLVAIAAILAFVVAGFVMNKWLEDFAYRISMPWWIFLLAGLLATVIALATISFQAIKTAVANPVKSLRTE
ncbi:MAG TPA: FtsX-like permease family protein [Chitinophagaceae bacterium]